MTPVTNGWKSTSLKILLVGAFGGMVPKLIELAPRLFNNDFPSSGFYYGLGLLALFGFITAMVSKESNLKKVLVLGAGAPAILASLTTTAVAPGGDAAFLPLSITAMHIAYAAEVQPGGGSAMIGVVVDRNESPDQLNRLWLRSGDQTLGYRSRGNIITVEVAEGSDRLRIDFPDARGVTVELRGRDLSAPMHISILNNRSVRDFWQAFGGRSLPKYYIAVRE